MLHHTNILAELKSIIWTPDEALSPPSITTDLFSNQIEHQTEHDLSSIVAHSFPEEAGDDFVMTQQRYQIVSSALLPSSSTAITTTATKAIEHRNPTEEPHEPQPQVKKLLRRKSKRKSSFSRMLKHKIPAINVQLTEFFLPERVRVDCYSATSRIIHPYPQRNEEPEMGMDEYLGWKSIQHILWENDDALTPAHSLSEHLTPTSSLLIHVIHQHTEMMIKHMASYLDLFSLAKCAKSCQVLRQILLPQPALWKQSIRLSNGLPHNARAGIWTAVFYGPLPWTSTCAQCSMDRLSGRIEQQREGTQVRRHAYDRLLRRATRVVENLLPSKLTKSEDSNFNSNSNWILDIDTDVSRTCVSEKSQEQLRRLLRAYVMYNPEVGYCQGMNFIVRLLMDISTDESEIFWLLVKFCDRHEDAHDHSLHTNVFRSDFKALEPLVDQLRQLLRIHLPQVDAHLRVHDVDISFCATRWIITLFANFDTLGPAQVLRLWDLYVLDHWRVIFGAAMAVLLALQSQLTRCRDIESILATLQCPTVVLNANDHVFQLDLLRKSIAFSITQRNLTFCWSEPTSP